MEDNEDEPEDVKKATPVSEEVKKGGKDETAKNPEAAGKKKEGKVMWCDQSARKPTIAKSEADCCRNKNKKHTKTPNVMSVMVYSPPCNLPKLEIIPRHCLSKQEYTDLLATPSRKCPMPCLGKTVVRKIRPISGHINEMAKPARRLVMGTLQERGASLPPEMISNLVKTIEGSACLSPEQAEQYFRDKKTGKVKDRKCGKNLKHKCKGKPKTDCPSRLDKEAVMCQYLMAERFVRSILQWKCPIPVDEFKDIASVILKRLSFVLEYIPEGQEDLKSQQMRFLADIIACWISGVLFEVADEHKDEIDQEEGPEEQEEDEDEEEEEELPKKPKIEPKDEDEDEKEEKETEDIVLVSENPDEAKEKVVIKLENEDSEDNEADKIKKEKLEAEEKEKKEAEEKEKKEAEEKAKLEAEENAKKEAEEKARKEAEEQEKLEAERKKKREEEEAADKAAREKREEERRKKLEEEEEEDNKRRKEAEERRQKEEEEDKERRKKKLQEEEEEDEKRRKKRLEEEEEDNKRRLEAEERRKKAEAEEEADRKKRDEEAKKKRNEEEKIKSVGPTVAIAKIGEGDLFKTDIPFVTFGKIMDTVYNMMEDEPEVEDDIIHSRLQRAVYEKLSRLPDLERPETLTENLKDVIDVVSGKMASWVQRLLKDSELGFLADNPPQVESGEVRDWGKWIDQVTDRAGDWADWIHRVVNDAEEKSHGVNRGDWQNWTSDTETNALLWRRYYLETLHQAHHNKMMVADRPVVKTGEKVEHYSPIEKEIKNTDLRV